VSAATVESDGYRHLLDDKGFIEGKKAKARLDGSRAFFVSISSIAVLTKLSAKEVSHMALIALRFMYYFARTLAPWMVS
jgi:hypothetical protein